MLLDRTHDMIGLVFHITSEDMSATMDISAMVQVLTNLVPRAFSLGKGPGNEVGF